MRIPDPSSWWTRKWNREPSKRGGFSTASNYICSAVLTVFVLAYFIFKKSFEESLGNAVGIALGVNIGHNLFQSSEEKEGPELAVTVYCMLSREESHRYSSYTYCLNNSLKFRDPDTL